MLLNPGLYIVSTPIGNLEDITLRAIRVLKNSTHIACEDTRVTSKLLEKYDIKKPLITYNDHSNAETREYIKKLICQNGIISLVSDAGTPMISDPGYKLVRFLQEANYHVDAIPGPCSPITALTISGLPTNSFFFGGFLPKSYLSTKKFLQQYVEVKSTLIFFVTSNRLIDSLQVMLEVYGNIEACVSKELTKYFQNIKRNQLKELIEYYKIQDVLRGEMIVLISNIGNTDDKNFDGLSTEIDKLLLENISTRDCVEKLYTKYNHLYTKSKLYKTIVSRASSNLKTF